MSASGESIQVALIAPALSVRLGLRALLSELPGMDITGEAATPAEADWLLHRAQVIILAGRPAASFRGLGESGPAVLLLFDDQPLHPTGRISAPAWGVLPLDSSAQELRAAVEALAAGLCVADPGWVTGVLTPFSPLDGGIDPDSNLTPRETEVLQQLAFGFANKQIAARLGLSENTVKFHISAIYAKLGASNRAEAVRLGVRQGVITL